MFSSKSSGKPLEGLGRGGTEAHAGCRDGSGLQRGQKQEVKGFVVLQVREAMAWTRVGKWRWGEADRFERFLKIKRMDLVVGHMVGMKKRKKPKMTVEFFGLSHWSYGVANGRDEETEGGEVWEEKAKAPFGTPLLDLRCPLNSK